MAPNASRAMALAASLLTTLGVLGGGLSPAGAVNDELEDGAASRVEQQPAAADGRLPLPESPDTARLAERLAARGLKLGSAAYVRIFKEQSELELWLEKEGSYQLFSTYPICKWSGTLGPKLRQGDKQTPEGFYTVTSSQISRTGRWPIAMNIGYPNPFDRALSRSGSLILVHGGCTSIGCFAMTDPMMTEIYAITAAALNSGQRFVPVHSFPFRLTEENIARHGSHEWTDFWRNLKGGYDIFEQTRRPPHVKICAHRYSFTEVPAKEVAATGPLSVCEETLAAIGALESFEMLVPPAHLHRLLAGALSGLSVSASLVATGLHAVARRAAEDVALASNVRSPQFGGPRRGYSCSQALPSCRRFIALRERIAARRTSVAGQHGSQTKTALRSRR